MALRNYTAKPTLTAVASANVLVGATSAVVGATANLPVAPFTAVFERGTANEEVVLVTAVNTGTNTVTITRAYDGTTAFQHNIGAAFEHCTSAIDYSEANAHVNATSNVHGVTGTLYSTGNPPPYPVTSVAGRTGAVTLTAADVAAGTFPGANSFSGLQTFNAGISVPSGQPLTTGTRAVVTGTRTTTTNASDTVDLGTFSTTGGAIELRIHAHLAAPAAGTTASVTKVYEIAAGALMGTASTWYLCLPADASANAAATNDFALEVQRTAAGVFQFRFRQKSIGIAGSIAFVAETLGDTAVTFTPSTTVTAAPAAVSTPHPSNAFTAAAGNVGIGTEAPGSLFTVNGAVTATTVNTTSTLSENGNRVYSAANANLSSATPAPIAAAGTAGTGTTYSRADHVHSGVSGLTAGTGISLSGSLGNVTITRQALTAADIDAGTFPGSGIYNVASGALSVGPAGSLARLSASAASATDVPFRARGFSGQSVNLTEWQNSSGTALAWITQLGVIAGRSLNVLATAVTDVPVMAQGMAGQTGDLTQWQNSAGTVLGKVSSDGSVYGAAGHFGVIASPPSAYLTVVNAGDFPGIIVKGVSGQTTDLQVWENSGGGTLAKTDSGGGFWAGGVHAGSIGASHPSAFMTVVNSSDVPSIICKANSTQTSAIQAWEASGGGVIAQITGGGNVQGTGSYTVLSDVSVKQNVRALVHDPFEVIRRLRPVHFDYIDGETDQVGFVAQEVRRVLPNAVVPFGKKKDKQLGLRDSAILAYLVAAVQQLIEAA